MNYEQKYNEALERAMKLKENPQSVFNEYSPKEGDTICDYIFPELKESEDERIRKEIIDFIDTKTIDSDERRNRWFSYLEKYRPISFTSLEDTEVKMSLMQYISELNQDVVHLHPGIETCNEWIAWLENIPYTIDHEKREGFHLGYKAALEKQGEKQQKTPIWKHWKDGIAGNGEGKPIYLIKYGHTYSLSSCLCFECDYIKLSELDKLMLEKQETSYTKRDVDDAYLKGISDAKNELEKQGEQKPAWNEEDINKPNGGIVMEDFNDGNGFYKVNLAYLNEEQVKEIEELVKRWDGQPKEDEDESIISDLLDYFDEDKCLKHEVNDIVKWLKTIKPQQKGWSDNEIKMFDNLITYLDGRKGLLEEIKRTYIDWLKSIKSRVKPKQEWSEEDQNALEDVREAVVHYWGGETQDILLYWLKSIKQRIKKEAV